MMTISQFSARTGLAPSALRYYESEGLLEPAERQSNGYRRYSELQIPIGKLINSLRQAGVSMAEIARFPRTPQGDQAEFLARWRREGCGLRLLFGAGQAIFGKAGSDTLCWVDPWTGSYTRLPGAGRLPAGEVTLRLELEGTAARIGVNGEERFVTEGVYHTGLAGQVGLGVPASAAVTLHALTVSGEAVTLGHKLQKPGPIDYDGGLIDVLYDHHPQMLAWYTEHLGLKEYVARPRRPERGCHALQHAEPAGPRRLPSVLGADPQAARPLVLGAGHS